MAGAAALIRREIARRILAVAGKRGAPPIFRSIARGDAWVVEIPDGFLVLEPAHETPDGAPGLFILCAECLAGSGLKKLEPAVKAQVREHNSVWVIFRSNRQGYIRALGPEWTVESYEGRFDEAGRPRIIIEFVRRVGDGRQAEAAGHERQGEGEHQHRQSGVSGQLAAEHCV